MRTELSIDQVLSPRIAQRQAYRYLTYYFHRRAPAFIREHRAYFSSEGRGFGEDVFHAMWWLIFLKYQPTRLLEIGVHRGQVISLWALIAKHLGLGIEVHGLSPFDGASDQGSRYDPALDYERDVVTHFAHFGLSAPHLTKAYSDDEVGKAVIGGSAWDVVYIDGSHDYNVVRSDYLCAATSVRIGGLMIFDDAGLYGGYRPPLWAFRGHAGPSTVALEVDLSRFRRLGSAGHNVIFERF